MNKLTLSLLAALAGAGITWSVLRSAPSPEPAAAAAPQARPADTAKIAELNAQVAKMRTQLAALEKPAAAPEASGDADEEQAKAGEAAKKAREAMEKQRREAMEKRLEEKMERLTTRLALNPQQAAATRDWQRSWMEAQLAAGLKTPRDPRDYYLTVTYRQDLPPAVQAALSAEQQPVWKKHDDDARADAVETITNGEIGYISRALDLSRDQKDLIFPKLSELYVQDTYHDFSGVTDIATLAAQKDSDNARRREFYSTTLTPDQLQKWEGIAADYKKQMLQGFGAP
jgi:hypothetical protein